MRLADEMDWARKIDAALTLVNDPEKAHTREDELMRAYIANHAPGSIVAQFERLWGADFPRWSS